jgi:arsenate reductase
LTITFAIGSLMVILIWKKLPVLVLAGGIIASDMPKKSIVFLCQHGGAKSLIAASYFNRLNETAHLPYVASAAATEKPYEAVPSKIADFLERDGFAVRSFKPHRMTPSELAGAARVISIGCHVRGRNIERWDDVPMVDDDLPGSAAAIRAHIAKLVKQLEARP